MSDSTPDAPCPVANAWSQFSIGSNPKTWSGEVSALSVSPVHDSPFLLLRLLLTSKVAPLNIANSHSSNTETVIKRIEQEAAITIYPPISIIKYYRPFFATIPSLIPDMIFTLYCYKCIFNWQLKIDTIGIVIGCMWEKQHPTGCQ